MNKTALTIERTESIDSTNAELKRRIAAGSLDGVYAITAAEQTQGRGRRGRSWLNTDGALLMSLALPLHGLDSEAFQLVSAAAALGAFNACYELGLKSAGIKWPNDIVAASQDDLKKLAGILTELVYSPSNVAFAVIGIGINANCTALPEGLLQPASSLKLTLGRDIDLIALAEAVCSEVLKKAELLLYGEKARLLSEYKKRLITLEREVTVFFDNAESVRGKAVGLDESGRLIVQTDSNRLIVDAGDVSLRLRGGHDVQLDNFKKNGL